MIMKRLTFACCLIFLSVGLRANESAAQNEEQPPASDAAQVTAPAVTDEGGEKKTVRRVKIGPARPRLFGMRRTSR